MRRSIQRHELPQGLAAGAATAMRQLVSKALAEVESVTKAANAFVKAGEVQKCLESLESLCLEAFLLWV